MLLVLLHHHHLVALLHRRSLDGSDIACAADAECEQGGQNYSCLNHGVSSLRVGGSEQPALGTTCPRNAVARHSQSRELQIGD